MSKQLGYWNKPAHELAVVHSPDDANAKDGYISIKRHGVRVFLHNWIWEYYNGPIPDGYEVDHINGIPTDCRLINMRLVSHMINCRNRRKRNDNTSGTTGVYRQWKKTNEYWTAAWNDPHTGKLRTKSFNIGVLGDSEAKDAAIAYRATIEADLVKNHNYTLRHGR